MVVVSGASPPPGARATLAANGLGLSGVLAACGAAIAPAVVVAGLIGTGYAVTGVSAFPVALLVVAVVIAVFCPAYLAMSRRVRNAGAFYAYIARAGRPAGVGAAFVALPAYAALGIGTFGAIGPVGSVIIADVFGVRLSWWLVALLAWLLVGVFGALRISISARFLAVALLAEVVIVLVANAVNLAHPHDGTLSAQVWNPGSLAGQWGPALAIAATAFVGVESAAVFTEESRSRATVPQATALALGTAFVLYAVSGWAMAATVGTTDLPAAAAQHGPDLPFALAAQHLGSQVIVDVGRLLFVTSLIAAALAYHNAVSRYAYALGREGVLPRMVGRINPATAAPVNASLIQSLTALVVIAGCAISGVDPLVRLFFWAGTIGGFGILTLLAATSIAAIIALRHHRDIPTRTRLVYPALATIGLAAILWLITGNITMLLGVPADHPAGWAVPVVLLALAAAGTTWGLILKTRRPLVYQHIGHGDTTHTTTELTDPAGPPATTTREAIR